jgi:hypothetical protein
MPDQRHAGRFAARINFEFNVLGAAIIFLDEFVEL